MNNGILLGVFWHFIGATSAACFYAPLKKVRIWSWELMWSVAGLCSWIILPWVVSYWLLPDFWSYYGSFNLNVILPIFLFGAMWGVGNIGYGLTMRYLGMSMGIGIAIGITLVVGTLATPLLQGNFMKLAYSPGGKFIFLGVFTAVIGIAIVSYAGVLKERAKQIKTEDFHLKRGLLLACLCGIFSAGMSFAINAATPMHLEAAKLGISPLFVDLPSYVIIMGGGAIVNLGFCFYRLLNYKALRPNSISTPLLLRNIFFSVLGGSMWYFQFFFYAFGHANIPSKYSFISWMLHMSFYVLCGGIVGLILKEWGGIGKKPIYILCTGCLIIIVAANIVGWGMQY